MRGPSALRVAIFSLALFFLTGCRSIGPGTVSRDRFSYSGALAESWKDQMLLNLVKTRYLDLPIYLEVGQIVSGYSLERSVSINGQVAKTGAGDQILGARAGGTFTDRPTITYTPLTGEKFLESFLGPLPPTKIFSLLQSGYAADFVLEMGLDSLNGLRNRPATIGSKYKADPEFYRVLALLRDVQDAGAIGLRVIRPTNSQPATVLFLRSENIDAETGAKLKEIRELLGINANESEYRLVQSPVRSGAGELSVGTRSLMKVIAALSFGVEIPPGHVQGNLAPDISESLDAHPPLLRVHSGSSKPASAFAAVPYLGEWFWIANDDWRSKRTFTGILFLFTLANGNDNDRLPLLTIPTG